MAPHPKSAKVVRPKSRKVRCPVQRCGKAPYREDQCDNRCRKHLIERLDQAARAQVMERDAEKCRRCGSVRVVQWSHWPSRSYHATRWRLEGAVAHCSQCHIDLTYRPLEHEQHMIDLWGEAMLLAIKRRALDGAAGTFNVDLVDAWDFLVNGNTAADYGREIKP